MKSTSPRYLPQAFQFPPTNMEEPDGGLANNLTAVTSLLRERKEEVSVWMERLRAEILRIRTSAATLLHTPGEMVCDVMWVKGEMCIDSGTFANVCWCGRQSLFCTYFCEF